MRAKNLVFVFLPLFCLNAARAREDIDSVIKKSASDITERCSAKAVLAIDDFESPSQAMTLYIREQLADSIFEYWENEYIYRSSDLTWEPSEENQNRLAAYLAFLENSDEYQELISDADWEEFGRLVNFEAEDLDVYVLQDLMKILVSKGAY